LGRSERRELNPVENRIHRLSRNQLRALSLFAHSRDGVVDSLSVGKKIDIEGKALGGLFSSLVRQKISGKSLIQPWGKSLTGRGLRWKLNSEVVAPVKLQAMVNKLADYWKIK